LLEQASCSRRNCRRRKSGYENLEPTAGAAQLAEFELFARLGDQEGCDALVGSLLTLRVAVRLPVGLWRRQLGDRRKLSMRCASPSSPTSSRVARALLKSFIIRIIRGLLRDARHRFAGRGGEDSRRRNLQPASCSAIAGPEAVVTIAHRK
jgi:hypothetical protein